MKFEWDLWDFYQSQEEKGPDVQKTNLWRITGS